MTNVATENIDLSFQTLYANLIEAMQDGVLVVTPQGDMHFFNQRFVEIWNLPAEVAGSRSDEAALGVCD